MSWLSAAWKRNKNAIESVVKPLASHIPVVGDTIASRIQMSPTATQAAASNSVNTALQTVGARVALVNAESSGTLPAPVGSALAFVPPGITPTQLAIAGGLLVALLLISRRK